MEPKPLVLATKPLSSRDELLKNRFEEEVVAQVARMDELCKLLITIQLAVPGLYATALKMIYGDQPSSLGLTVGVAFVCWFISLVTTLWAILPRAYRVDHTRVSQSHKDKDNDVLSIEGFFQESARFKYHRIVTSTGFFFAGIVAATVSIL